MIDDLCREGGCVNQKGRRASFASREIDGLSNWKVESVHGDGSQQSDWLGMQPDRGDATPLTL